MQRKDIDIFDQNSRRRLTVAVPPEGLRLTVGGSAAAHIVLPELEADAVAAVLAVEGELAAVHRISKRIAITLNGQPVGPASPLAPGDDLRIGSRLLRFRRADTSFRIDVTIPEATDTVFGENAAGLEGAAKAIAPQPFRPTPLKRPKAAGYCRIGAGAAIALAVVMLGGALWFVFTARQLSVAIEPPPENLSIRGAWPAIPIREHFLVQPGTYRLLATREGYRTLESEILITGQPRQTIALPMEKLPGRLSVVTHAEGAPATPVAGAQVRIGGRTVGATPLADIEVEAGRHALEIRSEGYQTLEAEIRVEGEGRTQSFTFGLKPNWAEVDIGSDPQGADIWVDGTRLGVTPSRIEVMVGSRRIEIRKPGFKSWQRTIEVEAGRAKVVETGPLALVDGLLTVTSTPTGANVMIGSDFMGQTPLEVALSPERPHQVHLSKPGYASASREVRVTPGEAAAVTVRLEPRHGDVHFRGAPADATLVVDGRPRGPVPDKLSLLAVPHRIEIRHSGFRTWSRQVTPRPGFPLELDVGMKGSAAADADEIRAPNGYRLRRIRPTAFRMGSSRREQGRRANETAREVRLVRPFYMGLREVTNAEFRAFQPDHDSGTFKGQRLNLDNLPVSGITWEQAARFCNWLSRQAGLPPIYVEVGGKWSASAPLGTGFRLPTEAEWEFCARLPQPPDRWKYPWGNRFPPKPGTVNLADTSAGSILDLFVRNYTDGFPVASPAGAFPASPLGLFDMGGNVSEWCHDLYAITPDAPGRSATDPAGPDQGRHHVIKGGSWKQASIGNLRAAFRDYQDETRLDLGFRICRYADPPGEGP